MNDESLKPIGLIDSGVGGLTIAKAIKNTLPHESMIYFADTAHLPYGNKSQHFIQKRVLEIAELLCQKGCKLIVIACNSASAYAGEWLQTQQLGIEIKGVIGPTLDFLEDNHAGVNKIGLIGTHATIESNAYLTNISSELKAKLSPLTTPLLAPMIEEQTSSNIIKNTLENYFNQPELCNIEQMVLACTHYPLIADLCQQVYQNPLHIIDTPKIMAHAVRKNLEDRALLNQDRNPSYRFMMSDLTPHFKQLAREIFNDTIAIESASY